MTTINTTKPTQGGNYSRARQHKQLSENIGHSLEVTSAAPDESECDAEETLVKPQLPIHAAKCFSPTSTRSVLEIPLEELKPHPLSLQLYGDSAPEEIVESVQEEGVLTPLIVNSVNGRIVSGNTRYRACCQAQISKVPVIYTELTEEEEKLRVITSNVSRTKTNTQRAREFDALLALFKEKTRNGEKDESPATASLSKSQDKAAKLVGLGASSLKKGVSVLAAAEKMEASGEKDAADKLRRILEEPRGFDRAYKEGVRMGAITHPKKRLRKGGNDDDSIEESRDEGAPLAMEAETETHQVVGERSVAERARKSSSSPVSELEELTAQLLPVLARAESWDEAEKAAASASLRRLADAVADASKVIGDREPIST